MQGVVALGVRIDVKIGSIIGSRLTRGEEGAGSMVCRAHIKIRVCIFVINLAFHSGSSKEYVNISPQLITVKRVLYMH